MPRICAISFPINLSAYAPTFSQCCCCALQWEMHFSECYPVHCLALLRLVVWQAIVRSILQALTGPETCWHKALTDFLRMFSTNLWFHSTWTLYGTFSNPVHVLTDPSVSEDQHLNELLFQRTSTLIRDDSYNLKMQCVFQEWKLKNIQCDS